MISKVAIQAGIGVTTVGGVVGATAYYLLSGIIDEYLVEVQTNAGSDQPANEPIINDQKQYFCQWGEEGNIKTDNNCEIKQIKFDTNKKFVLLSDIKNNNTLENPTNTNLKETNSWFLLKIKGYTDKLETTTNLPNIDIVSTVAENNKNKTYTTVKPIVKIKSFSFEGKTNFLLTQLLKDPTTPTPTGSTYKCKLKKDEKLQECDVYKFRDQSTPTEVDKKINGLDFSAGKTSKIATSSTSDFSKNKFYLIDLKAEKLDLSKYSDELIVYVEIKAVNGQNTETTIGEFTIKSSLINKNTSASTITAWADNIDTIVLGY